MKLLTIGLGLLYGGDSLRVQSKMNKSVKCLKTRTKSNNIVFTMSAAFEIISQ